MNLGCFGLALVERKRLEAVVGKLGVVMRAQMPESVVFAAKPVAQMFAAKSGPVSVALEAAELLEGSTYSLSKVKIRLDRQASFLPEFPLMQKAKGEHLHYW